MKKSSLFAAAVAALTVVFSGLAMAVSPPPFVNGSFQTGDFTGWTIRDTTHCYLTLCGDGTASVQNCTPAAPGDADGYCAVFSGNNVQGGQNTKTVTAHKYSVSACAKHSGGGSATTSGPVYISLTGDTGWVCQTSVFNNPYGVAQRIAPLGMQEYSTPDKNGVITPGTGYFDQFVYTVIKQ